MPPTWEPGGPRFWIEGSARESGSVHAVFSERALPDDGANIFLTASYADDGEGYCTTLAARQGTAAWRKTIVRPSFVERDRRKSDTMGHSLDPQQYWTPEGDMHRLAEELALAMGLPLMAQHGAAFTDRAAGTPAPPSQPDAPRR